MDGKFCYDGVVVLAVIVAAQISAVSKQSSKTASLSGRASLYGHGPRL